MGITPEYFLDEMCMEEVDEILKAYSENYIEGWEKLRFIHNVIYSGMGVKFKPLKFTWDKVEEKIEVSPSEIEKSKNELIEMHQKIRNINGEV